MSEEGLLSVASSIDALISRDQWIEVLTCSQFRAFRCPVPQWFNSYGASDTDTRVGWVLLWRYSPGHNHPQKSGVELFADINSLTFRAVELHDEWMATDGEPMNGDDEITPATIPY